MGEVVRCSRCGETLSHATPSWSLHIELVSGFNGILDCSRTTAKEADRAIESVLRQIEAMDADMLENQIHQVFDFTLCRDCRDHFAANPLAIPHE